MSSQHRGGAALHCTALHCTALQCTQCTALHCTALHCTEGLAGMSSQHRGGAALHCTEEGLTGTFSYIGQWRSTCRVDLQPEDRGSSSSLDFSLQPCPQLFSAGVRPTCPASTLCRSASNPPLSPARLPLKLQTFSFQLFLVRFNNILAKYHLLPLICRSKCRSR
jgi:hypothetical protein